MKAYWDPPSQVLQKLPDIIQNPAIHRYGFVQGIPELIEELSKKIQTQNHLHHKKVIVTSGCNQAYVHEILTTCDPNDEVIMIAPYYFNHHMALQMLNVKPVIVDDLVGVESADQYHNKSSLSTPAVSNQ